MVKSKLPPRSSSSLEAVEPIQYTGIVTVIRYCNWCEIFNIIFSDTDIWSSFSFKMIYQFDGMDFFELADVIFVELHFVTLSVFSVSNGANLLLLFMLKSFFCLVLSMMRVFVVFLSLLPDKFSIISS